jgi:ribosome recycling factor
MADELIDEIFLEAEEKMDKAVEFAKESFAAIRTGRANAAMFSKIVVDYYGAPTPLQQLASISIPEARSVAIQPYDKSATQSISKALRDSDLGVNPMDDGGIIRINLPDLTEDRRQEYVKLAKHRAEEGRVAVRAIRRKAKEHLEQLTKDGDVGEDEVTRAEKELEALTHKHVETIDSLLAHKESELLEV